MRYPVQVHGIVCAACRLRAGIVEKQLSRTRQLPQRPSSARHFATNGKRSMPRSRPGGLRTIEADVSNTSTQVPFRPDLSVGDRIQYARQLYGDDLPETLLTEEELVVYRHLTGKASNLNPNGTTTYAEEEGYGKSDKIRAKKGSRQTSRYGDPHESNGYQSIDGLDSEQGVGGGRQDGRSTQSWDDARLNHDIGASLANDRFDESQDENSTDEDDISQRTHPLTLVNRFGTSPSTLYLPKDSFVDPATVLLSGMPTVHLSEAAHRVFGGAGLPYSTATPAIGKTMQARPIALDASQGGMSEIEGDVFMATLMPSMFASAMSVLVETRKRLGTAWAENMVKKAAEGELRILDAGGAGAGILAVREFLRAEWERMHTESATENGTSTSIATADGKVGGAMAVPPLGIATVLTGSDALRRRASQLLENTSFIPRLPDYIHSETAKQKGKFDIIIAPHTLWPLREDYMRKTHTQNLWSLLSTEGGVLVLLEKGVARGFELIASAREMLLESRIGNAAQGSRSQDIYEPEIDWEGEPDESYTATGTTREKGMIIAPCTNHKGCPMYVQKGMMKGRKDICHFEQRYIRPPFLQKIIGARDKNFEDVKFSYVAVMRGRDLREEQEANEPLFRRRAPVMQGSEPTDLAFEGFESSLSSEDASAPDSLSLPRAILPPLKRRGHVILDLCTSAGTLERWTVPRSFSKQAFRDARKSSWGDLWALGAKTRVPRNISKGPKHKNNRGDMDIKGRSKKDKNGDDEGLGGEVTVDEYGRLTLAEVKALPPNGREGGKMRTGKKVKGIRDKRDKKGNGNGRLKRRMED